MKVGGGQWDIRKLEWKQILCDPDKLKTLGHELLISSKAKSNETTTKPIRMVKAVGPYFRSSTRCKIANSSVLTMQEAHRQVADPKNKYVAETKLTGGSTAMVLILLVLVMKEVPKLWWELQKARQNMKDCAALVEYVDLMTHSLAACVDTNVGSKRLICLERFVNSVRKGTSFESELYSA